MVAGAPIWYTRPARRARNLPDITDIQPYSLNRCGRPDIPRSPARSIVTLVGHSGSNGPPAHHDAWLQMWEASSLGFRVFEAVGLRLALCLGFGANLGPQPSLSVWLDLKIWLHDARSKNVVSSPSSKQDNPSTLDLSPSCMSALQSRS